ncbi:MAG: trypsin-like peptidase domain-containing protein, partial [Deltaproteobacteria bacterium]|nr:trypsin-like peptidase domain-containing protein [Deltaproteobacteria bacterium]
MGHTLVDRRRDFFEPSRQYTQTSLGSGVIVDGKKGFVLTNYHVVVRATKITVALGEDRTLEAAVVGVDPDTDLAVLKINSPKPLPSIAMGNSDDLMIGETAIAIGNPFGLS